MKATTVRNVKADVVVFGTMASCRVAFVPEEIDNKILKSNGSHLPDLHTFGQKYWLWDYGQGNCFK
jgi:hypothetical protein